MTNLKSTLYGFDGASERRAIQPVPAGPTHCRCGKPLEPLRRYAGLCRACVLAAARPPEKTAARMSLQLRVVSESYRVRPDGRRERYVVVQCACGSRRRLKYSTWEHHRPRCCNKCRLRDIEQHGFEAEYGR